MHADAIAAPWYRHRWTWFVIAGPAIVVAASFVTLWLAVRSDDGVVADDYYKQGLGINRTLERAARAGALGLEATVDVAPDGTVSLRLASADPAFAPPTIDFTLAHPTTAAADRHATLARQPDGRYVGKVAPPDAGRWRLVVESGDWRLPAVETNAALAGIILRSDPPAR